ncbi:hypothetical protein O0I10_006454 [Lichtheimia ornata]|uniref:Uncharacterized protein n=1 Tax=Lichtheimia ornata TaxID=688661 RepID=A0AAD7V5D3_9FUNG|nr:uncharacterized protein O0I10_006454 [Lichtheimia ornata]KAJ8657926.1 hypothetical protein O0I10_006454 [Lichtheimia ornata]
MSSQNLTKLPDKETGTQNRPQRLSYAKATRRPSLICRSLKTPTGPSFLTTVSTPPPDHARRIVELFIADKKDYSKIKFMGISFPDNQCILPSIPLLLMLALYTFSLDLPFTTRDTLSNGIQGAIFRLWQRPRLCILRDYDSHLFMGKGYATSNT